MPRLLLATAYAVASLFSLALNSSRVLAQTNDDFAFGVIVDSTDPRSMARAREAGFTHAKMMTFWDRLEPAPGDFYWNRTDQNDLDNILRAAANEEMSLVVRVDNVPGGLADHPRVPICEPCKLLPGACRARAGDHRGLRDPQ